MWKKALFGTNWLVIILTTATSVAFCEEVAGRHSIWVDVYRGEPEAYENVLDDLAEARVIYLGECHSLERHHETQLSILRDLAERNVPLVLGLEQIESFQQPALDEYNEGKIGFDQLVEATQWEKRWRNYLQYRPLLEKARESGIPILALNARFETIRQVARSGGLDKIDAEARKELPAEIHLDDPVYEKFLNLQLMVHMSATSERLRPMREAQICRDEMMAYVLSSFLQSDAGRDRTAVVLCGAGHVEFGLGMPARVRRRITDVRDRIILLSQSGDLELSPEEKAMAREIEITHEQLREIDRPIADYLHVRSLAGGTANGRTTNEHE